VTSETPQGNISILHEGVSDFTNLHISQFLTLFLTSFYCVYVCLSLVNTKVPPFDKILRKDANCVSNKLLWVLITVVVSTKNKVYIFYLRNNSYCVVFIPSCTEWQNWYFHLRTMYAAKFEQTITHQHVILRLESKSYWWSICNNDSVFARFNCTSHIRGLGWLKELDIQIT
jgi:hypothetical protein